MLVGIANRITFGIKEITAVAAKAFCQTLSELTAKTPISSPAFRVEGVVTERRKLELESPLRSWNHCGGSCSDTCDIAVSKLPEMYLNLHSTQLDNFPQNWKHDQRARHHVAETLATLAEHNRQQPRQYQ